MYPILSFDQMRRWEELSWKQGIRQEEVIHQAGVAVGRSVLKWIQRVGLERILVLAGPGHNGDDARVAAEFLSDFAVVQVLEIKKPEEGLRQLRSIFSSPSSPDSTPQLIVDGLFGIGLSRSVEGDWLELIRLVNALRLPVISVDTPSGLNAEGKPFPKAIRAVCTLTLGAPKKSLVSCEAANYTGEIRVLAPIGLAECSEDSDMYWLEDSDFKNLLSPRALDSHKGDYGHLLIVAGSLGYHGAAVLAAKAACTAGPGLISVCTQPEVYIPVASQLQVQMVHSWSEGWKVPESVTSIMVGPGLASDRIPEAFWEWAGSLWKNAAQPMIADASALDRLPHGEAEGVRVITPHPGEAARCLQISTERVQRDRLGALRKLSQQYGGATVVLKGYQTLIGRASGKVMLNPTGTPSLAQGGTGDVLAGFLGGLLAHPPHGEDALCRNVAYTVYRHGLAAEKLDEKMRQRFHEGESSLGARWTAEDLIREL
jgi:NAD(P)H-hydrate epimerase